MINRFFSNPKHMIIISKDHLSLAGLPHEYDVTMVKSFSEVDTTQPQNGIIVFDMFAHNPDSVQESIMAVKDLRETHKFKGLFIAMSDPGSQHHTYTRLPVIMQHVHGYIPVAHVQEKILKVMSNLEKANKFLEETHTLRGKRRLMKSTKELVLTLSESYLQSYFESHSTNKATLGINLEGGVKIIDGDTRDYYENENCLMISFRRSEFNDWRITNRLANTAESFSLN